MVDIGRSKCLDDAHARRIFCVISIAQVHSGQLAHSPRINREILRIYDKFNWNYNSE